MGKAGKGVRAAVTLLVLAGIAGCGRPAPAPPARPAADARPLKPCLAELPTPDPANRDLGMMAIPGGTYAMGAASLRPEEGPARKVRIKGFRIDRTEVTNAAFARFVDATGYVTLSERPLDPKLYPGLPASALVPSSLVFVGLQPGVARDRPDSWWRVIPGADWRHPQGPGSNIDGKGAWPVVHIAYDDALAYARWLGRDLPTEAEWEYAARGGLAAKRYAWGDAPQTAAAPKANTWQGVFPAVDTGQDGYKAQTAPVGCYPANGYGLDDMAGNVWEWTQDWYHPGLDVVPVEEGGGPPKGMARDPDEPDQPKHVIKGGSFLCSDDYCFRYRPAAREAGPPDSGSSHVGFRTVLRE